MESPGDSDSGGGDSDDDDDNYDFYVLGDDDLRIISVLLDDLHTGASSKKRFFRDQRDEDLRFELNQEVHLYINNHSMPYLRDLVLDSADCKSLEHVYMRAHAHTHTHTHTHIYIHTHTHAHTHVCAHTHTHAKTHSHMYIHTDTYTLYISALRT